MEFGFNRVCTALAVTFSSERAKALRKIHITSLIDVTKNLKQKLVGVSQTISCYVSLTATVFFYIFAFRMTRTRREMYCGHARLFVSLCVCVCVCPRPHAYTIARTLI